MSCDLQLLSCADLVISRLPELVKPKAAEPGHYDFFTKLLANPDRGVSKMNKGNNPGGRVYDHKLPSPVKVGKLRILTPAGCSSLTGCRELDRTMQDFWMVFFTAAFFVMAFSYVRACQKLR
jgi:hypothetical protein